MDSPYKTRKELYEETLAEARTWPIWKLKKELTYVTACHTWWREAVEKALAEKRLG